MTFPGSQQRRTIDIVANTVTAVAMVIGSTVLGIYGVLAPEGVLGAYGIAAAAGGLPIVVKRNEPPTT